MAFAITLGPAGAVGVGSGMLAAGDGVGGRGVTVGCTTAVALGVIIASGGLVVVTASEGLGVNDASEGLGVTTATEGVGLVTGVPNRIAPKIAKQMINAPVTIAPVMSMKLRFGVGAGGGGDGRTGPGGRLLVARFPFNAFQNSPQLL